MRSEIQLLEAALGVRSILFPFARYLQSGVDVELSIVFCLQPECAYGAAGCDAASRRSPSPSAKSKTPALRL